MWLVPFAVPRQLYLEMPMDWCKHLKWACSGVPRLAVLPGSNHSNPLFHFSGLSFWHSEKHHLKLIKASYFVQNLTHYQLCLLCFMRGGGFQPARCSGLCYQNSQMRRYLQGKWDANGIFTNCSFCTDYWAPLAESACYTARQCKLSGNTFLRRFTILVLLLCTTL